MVMTAAIGMEAQSTSMKIRAQDDETLEGLKLSLTIPGVIQDGPEDDHIKMMVEDSKKAVKDPQGNFLKYVNVNLEGKIAPNISLLSLTSPTGNWPPTEAKILIEPYNQNKKQDIKVQQTRNGINYIDYVGFIYDIPNADEYFELYLPYSLKALNKNRQPLETRLVHQMPFFDAVSVFGTIRYVFNMYEKDINEIGNARVKTKWRNRGITTVYPFMSKEKYLEIYPEGKYEDLIGNAFYDLKDGRHLLCFFPIDESGQIHTSQSTDTLIHETSHLILNIIRPDIWDVRGTSSALAAFHESFGDLSAQFTLLTFDELNRLVIEKTQGDLHHSSFLSVVGEKIVNRDAAGYTDLLATPSCEEHDLSERLTRGIYGTLADTFWSKNCGNPNPNPKKLLFELSNNLRQLFLQATLNFSIANFTFAEFGRKMIEFSWKTEGLSYFAGHIYGSFSKQGIDLQDLSWKICVAPASGESKWRCSTSANMPKPESSHLQQLDIIKQPTYWYTKSFRPTRDNKALAVIGRDDRSQVADTHGDPWRVHGHLFMDFEHKKTKGTGTLISPQCVLTAGHCLYDLQTHHFVKNITFYPGRNGKWSVAQPAKAIKWEVHPNYIKGEKEHDIGIIFLDRAVGMEVGWNGLLWAENSLLQSLSPIHISGYPGDKPKETMWTDEGEITDISGFQLFYLIDTNKGESGANLWVQLPNSVLSIPKGFYSIGVHTNGQNGVVNKATQLTQWKVDWLVKLMNNQ